MQKQPGTAGANVKAHHAAAVTEHRDLWPLSFAIAMLAISGVGAAFVSEWFVHALEPFIKQLGISEAFAGLVIVAIAGNAIENVVGIQLAAKGQADYAVSVILQSPLQVALVLAPLLVLLSHRRPRCAHARVLSAASGRDVAHCHHRHGGRIRRRKYLARRCRVACALCRHRAAFWWG